MRAFRSMTDVITRLRWLNKGWAAGATGTASAPLLLRGTLNYPGFGVLLLLTGGRLNGPLQQERGDLHRACVRLLGELLKLF